MNTKEYISSGIIESFVLGLASKEEVAILECIMKNNAEVKTSVEEAQKTLEDLALLQSVAPPEDLKYTIWAKIHDTQKTETKPSSNIPEINIRETAIASDNMWRKYAIAASVLFLISILGNLLWINERSKDKIKIADLTTEKNSKNIALLKMQEKWKIVSGSHMQLIILKGVEKHPDSKAIIFWDQNTKEVYLNAEGLPQPPEGMQYQLWAISDGKPLNAGMYTPSKDTRIALSKIPEAQAFAITLEKVGGNTTPTLENMFVIGNI
ncbi:anti-sigma factor [Chryseobacterium sp.]|uniref:anti-sigma factor n=1 Tax=Chryseobacterium sp. TaxID=1871047 RepID=UPI0025C174BF|nr:anti-sigma factor [Chryseobacterium sp.]